MSLLDKYGPPRGLSGAAAPETASDVWLLDCSGSMQGARIRILKEALARWLEDAGKVGVRPALIAFAMVPRRISAPHEVLHPEGGTRLDLALRDALALMPASVVVFTDGEPHDEAPCLELAKALPGTLEVVFCGDREDSGGLDFCRKLARAGGGRFVARDIAQGQGLLCGEVTELLGLPAPRAL